MGAATGGPHRRHRILAGVVLSLAVTSSTSVVGVAIGSIGSVTGGSSTSADQIDVLACNQVLTDRRHAEELTPLLERTLSEAGVGLNEVELFVVDVGPGRFTGLRVGLATVRTLALATGAPVVGLSSLEVLAWAEPARPVVAVVDARRAEVFQQRFNEGHVPSGPPVVGSPEELSALAAGATVVGDGADRYAALYEASVGATIIADRVPSAAAMLEVAVGREAQPGPAVTPLYLRDPDVNVNIKTRHTPR